MYTLFYASGLRTFIYNITIPRVPQRMFQYTLRDAKRERVYIPPQRKRKLMARICSVYMPYDTLSRTPKRQTLSVCSLYSHLISSLHCIVHTIHTCCLFTLLVQRVSFYCLIFQHATFKTLPNPDVYYLSIRAFVCIYIW